MTIISLTKTRIHAGIWEGVLLVPADQDAPPQIEVTHLERPILGHALTEDADTPGTWHLRIAIPPDTLGDGVQTFLILNAETGETLDQFSIITGEPLQADVRAEVDLLRAELDMLKRAFRRHCVETTGY